VTTTARIAIVDFDGTLVDLRIDWPALRSKLGVRSIDDLHHRESGDAWSVVRAEEVRAATSADAVEPVITFLEAAARVAILTANSEDAVGVFLERRPDVAARVVAVVGRESCGGPKRDQAVFGDAYARCVAALGSSDGAPLYVGDQDYELRFAVDLGAEVVDARLLLDAAGHNRPRGSVGH
jgi:phosphoglycolate phosphatase-like HAD superfamily hydrolase